MNRPISAIARDIATDWKKVSPYAAPYLRAMFYIRSVADTYFSDDGRSVVLYFLSNASSWRGDKAKVLKAELKALLK
jgi:hypothetical protein